MEELSNAIQFLSDKVDVSTTLIVSIKKEFSEIKKEIEIIKTFFKVRAMEQY